MKKDEKDEKDEKVKGWKESTIIHVFFL